MKLKFACVLALLLAGTAAAESVVTGTLSADPAGSKISKHIYGQFAEHLGAGIYEGIWVGPDSPIPNTRGIRKDVVAALKQLDVPVVRWPGGCFADEYHWRDGIGPREQRPQRKNNWWGGTPESNAFGSHEFFDFARQIGAEAYISVNVASGTPMMMREWIEYMTSTGSDTLANERRRNGQQAPFEVAFIGIGNESWGCGGFMTPEYYADEYRKFSAFFHKNGTNFHLNNDNKAIRVASGANNLDTNWTKVVMTKAGPAMDAISLHFYSLLTGEWQQRNQANALAFPLEQWHEILYQASRMDTVLQQHIAVMDQLDPAKRISLYVDEWGTWYNTEPGTNPAFLYQQNTLRDALVAGITFNTFHQYADRIGMANIAQAVNVLQAMILTDKEKMAKTPTYYAFKMFKPFQDSTRLALALESPSLNAGDNRYKAITASAARARDGHVYIGITNADPNNAHTLNLNLKDITASGFSGELLTSNQLDAHNVPGEPERIAPVKFTAGKIHNNQLRATIPAKSLLVLKLI